jgi:hypothetical protein
VKKLPLFLFLLCIALSLRAQEEDAEGLVAGEQFRFKNRMVELSVANISLNISNDFIPMANVFNNPFYIIWNIRDIIHDPVRIYKDPVKVNLDDFLNGFNFNSSAAIKPLSLNFNWKDNWGVGFDVGHINVWGNFNIPVDVLTLKEATNERIGMGGAVFADAGIPVFFHFNELKIKFRPAVYVPLFYTRPILTYTYKRDHQNPETGVVGSFLDLKYDMRIYSLVDMQEDMMQGLADKARNIPGNNLGYDFGLCMEYPWDDSLDIGVNFVNIPIPYAAGKLNHYTQLSGSMGVDTSYIDMNGMLTGEISENTFHYDYDRQTYGYNSAGQKIYRPFTMLFYANYRLFDSYMLSLIPSLGFSINPFFRKPAGVEGGVSARLDLANIFITTLGINYNDRVWKNSVDFILNLRAFELDFGLSTQSSNFKKSWQGAGIGVNFGMKFGL